MKNNKRKAILLAALASISVLTGCNKKQEVKNNEPVRTVQVNKTPGLYDSEFRQVLEVATLKKNTMLMDSNLRFVRESNENEEVGIYFINDNYALIHDIEGNDYIVRNEALNITNSDIEDYYAYILTDTPEYKEPTTYSFEHTENMLNMNDLVLVIKDFGGKLYVLDDKGNPHIIRETDVERLSNKFIVIDISDQNLKLYNNTNVLIDSPVVTGRTNGNNPTPTYEGFFRINGNKTTNKYLKDNAYVEYWMPFINDTFGMHDASWRYGNFGGTIYQNNGSHGCVNMPHDQAEALYNNVEVGTPVLIKK